MDTKLKGYWEKAKEFFQKLSKKVKIALAVGVAVLLVLLVAGLFWLNRPEEYAVLFTDLESAEATQIISYLDNAGISSRLEGTTIYVPASQEPALKMRLVMEGYPQSGFGYETYLNGLNIGTTNAQERRLYILALAERLEATISTLDGVSSAKVQISEGEDTRYVLDSSNMTKASAAVKIQLAPGRDELTSGEADGIRLLISRSVQGLDVGDVAIVDNKGHTYTDVSGIGELSDGTSLKLKFEEWAANRIRNEIYNALRGPFGEGNVDIGVSVTADVSVRVREIESFTHPDMIGEDGEGVIGQKYWLDQLVRDGELPAGGVPGTSTNSDLNNFNDYVDDLLQDPGENNSVIGSGQTDYQNPTTTEQEKGVAGTITDVSVAVSVNHENDGSINEEELRAHVARAAGILPEQEEKVHIWITPFYNFEEPPVVSGNPFRTVPTWALYAAVAGLILFIILLAVILSISKKRQKQREKEMLAALGEAEAAALAEAAAAAGAGNPMAPPQTGADIMDINAEKSMELRKTVRQFVNNNPEIAAQMLKTWLRGGEENA